MGLFTFVTGNKNKLNEITSIFGSVNHKNIELNEYQGNPEFVATMKCKEAAMKVDGPVLIEDTCLYFNALSNETVKLPGVYIKYFVEIGLTKLVKMLQGFDDKTACSMCTFAYTNGINSEIQLFSSYVNGVVVEPRGTNGFGYDKIFQPNTFTQTYAEMDPNLKNTISDRSKALDLVKEYFYTKLQD